MISVENIEVFGWEAAIRGMRNPMNSWDKIDSHAENGVVDFGFNDISLMLRLMKAGPEHRKFLRMVHVQMDITAPLYWWKEYDTYKVGTVANSCSTMHRIHAKEFSMDDFSHEHLAESERVMEIVIDLLNAAREAFNATHDKKYWWQMIQLLPESYNQRRTVDFNYETAMAMIQQRERHKLDEWHDFTRILKELPCFREIGGLDG